MSKWRTPGVGWVEGGNSVSVEAWFSQAAGRIGPQRAVRVCGREGGDEHGVRCVVVLLHAEGTGGKARSTETKSTSL